MKIKRFLGQDMRDAMQQVKKALGDDAVILSNKSVDDQVEILAAVDFDFEQDQSYDTLGLPQDLLALSDQDKEAKIINELKSIKLILQEISQADPYQGLAELPEGVVTRKILTDIGFSRTFATSMIQALHKQSKPINIKEVLDTIIKISKIAEVSQNRLKVFSGLSGVGTTTCLIKYAIYSRKVRPSKKLLLATTDLQKPLAYELLRNYADILNIEVLQIETGHDLIGAYQNKPCEILLDLSSDTKNYLKALRTNGINFDMYHIMSATSKLSSVDQYIKAHDLNSANHIITKLDEQNEIQDMLCYMLENGLQLSFTSNSAFAQKPLQAMTNELLLSQLIKAIQSSQQKLIFSGECQ